MNIPLTMVCRKCRREQPFELFMKSKNSKFGRERLCRGCSNEKRKLYPKGDSSAYQAKYSARHREEISTVYVRLQLLSGGFRPQSITPELIEIKQQQLAMRRLARQLKKAANESISSDSGQPVRPKPSGDQRRSSSNRRKQPAGAGEEGNQRNGCGSNGEGLGLDQ